LKPSAERNIADVLAFVSSKNVGTSTDVMLRKYAKYNAKRRAGNENKAKESERSLRYRHTGYPAQKSNKFWTAEEIKHLEDLRSQGLSIRQISWVMGRGYSSVDYRWQTRGRHKIKNVWTPVDTQRLLEYRALGLSAAAIAEKLGRTAVGIATYYSRIRRTPHTPKRKDRHDKSTAKKAGRKA